MDKKIILDLCGGTGAWSKPYSDGGYCVINVTLPQCDVTKTVFNYRGCIRFRGPEGNVVHVVAIDRIHGILAAPPCTEFSLAKGSLPRDFDSAMKVVEACMKIIWEVRIRVSLNFWALENPRGFLRQFLGKPAYHFEGWWFGDNIKKPTDLWGYFSEPKKKRDAIKPDYPRKGKGSWAHRAGGGDPKRSITPTCFARAFFKANP